jgi:hypothetical protein
MSELKLFFINPPNNEKLERDFQTLLELQPQTTIHPIKIGWNMAMRYVQQWNIGFVLDGPHDDPDACPSWYDGCNCGLVKRMAADITKLKAALEREIAQCPDCEGSGVYSPMGDGDDCYRCKPSRDALKEVQ